VFAPMEPWVAAAGRQVQCSHAWPWLRNIPCKAGARCCSRASRTLRGTCMLTCTPSQHALRALSAVLIRHSTSHAPRMSSSKHVRGDKVLAKHSRLLQSTSAASSLLACAVSQLPEGTSLSVRGAKDALEEAAQVGHIAGGQLHVLVPAGRVVGLRGLARQRVQQPAGLDVHHAVARALTCQCGSAHLEQLAAGGGPPCLQHGVAYHTRQAGCSM
jgi:hypothetical protein